MSYDKIIEFWQNKNITTGADLELALNGQLINFAYHSGKIENEKITYNDTREIFERDSVSSYTGDLRTLFEIRNAKDSIYYMLSAFDKQRDLDADLLKALHYELTKNTYDRHRYNQGERPGEYKKHDYVTGREEVGALPEDVAAEIDELFLDLKQTNLHHNPQNILTAAVYFHAKIENIHPFADGNGRTGRLAANYWLVRHNHPPIIIFEEDRKSYYQALEKWDSVQDLKPLKNFFLAQLEKTWQKQLARHAPRKHIETINGKENLTESVSNINNSIGLSKIYNDEDEMWKDIEEH